MKIQATGNNDSSPFNRLPDEIVIDILKKIIDLKTLCFCFLVCKRFCSIVVQVDTISITFTAPPFVRDDGFPSVDSVVAFFKCVIFQSAIKSANKFAFLKSLSMSLPFPIQQQDNRYKWKVKLGNNRLDSFLFLSPNSIRCCNSNNSNENRNGNEDNVEADLELASKKLDLAFKCSWEAAVRFSIISFLPLIFPLLEKVSIADSAKTGTVSLSGEVIAELRNGLLSQSETIAQKLKDARDRLSRVSFCYIPLLELPVSKYVMKGVTLILMEMDDLPDGHDSFVDIVKHLDVFEENQEEAAFNEALSEILKKHRGSIVAL